VKVNINDGLMRLLVMKAVRPIVEQHAADIAKNAGKLASQRLGKYDAYRQGGNVGAYRRGTKVLPGIGSSPTKITVVVENAVAHAAIIEFGSRPHIIRPRRPGGRLRWLTGSGPVFAREVRHPGTRPYTILSDAARTTRLR